MITKQCVICGNTFETNQPHKKYCSIKCYDEAENRRKKADDQSALPRVSKCAHCGAEFTPKTHKNKYCSHKCALRHRDEFLREQAAAKRAIKAERESAEWSARLEEAARETQIHVGKRSIAHPRYDVAPDGKTLVRVVRSKWGTSKTVIRR